jgi:preprotein translocase subunit SecG
MDVFITILILLASIFLVLIVLVQNSKGGGLAAGFSSSNQVLGVRKTTDFLEKATWGAAGVVVILCIVITHYIPREKAVDSDSEVLPHVSLPVQQATPDFGTAIPQEGTTQQPETQQSQPELPVN